MQQDFVFEVNACCFIPAYSIAEKRDRRYQPVHTPRFHSFRPRFTPPSYKQTVESQVTYLAFPDNFSRRRYQKAIHIT